MTEKCKCSAATHGHEPGKCENIAMENSTCCEACEDQLAEENIGDHRENRPMWVNLGAPSFGRMRPTFA